MCWLVVTITLVYAERLLLPIIWCAISIPRIIILCQKTTITIMNMSFNWHLLVQTLLYSYSDSTHYYLMPEDNYYYYEHEYMWW
jgi:hypothetical protein